MKRLRDCSSVFTQNGAQGRGGETTPRRQRRNRFAAPVCSGDLCTGRCLAARRFSCPRACGPLRWEGRAISARPVPKPFGKRRAEGVLLRFCMPRPFFPPSFQSIFDPMCDRPVRRAILFCLLRSAIACRQVCRNARSEEKRFRICMIGPLFSDLRVEGERQAAHSHLDFELAIRVPVGRNGFGFIVQTQDVCAGDRKVAQPAFDLRTVMR